jgi:general L-amino acid transport system permease protein
VLFILIAVVGAMAIDPFTITVPQLQKFNFQGGITLSPEYVALTIGLVLYTGAFIAEIVRAGIQAVPPGLTEASRALGLTTVQTLRLVTVPVALRVIIPPLTNQFLNLAKNSSLAVLVAYPDLFFVGGGIYNQTGQTIQVVAMMMVTYLAISLVISVIMNVLNARFKLIER